MGEQVPVIDVRDVKESVENNPEATVKEKGGGIVIHYDTLIARRGNEFVFLDKVFDTGSMSGATGTTMAPVSDDEFTRRLEEYKDPEWSPYHDIYVEEVENGLDESWSEWIEAELAYGEVEAVLDTSYVGKYGDTVKTWASRELGFDPEYVECLGGGRMFSTAFGEFDRIYRPDLLAMAKGVEEHGLGVGDSSDESHTETTHTMSSEVSDDE